MMERKQRKHKISDKYPMLAMIINMAVGFLLFLVIGIALELVLGRTLNFLSSSYGYSTVISAFILLLLYKLWYKPEFEGALRGGQPGLGLKIWIPILISWVTVPFLFIFTDARFGWPTFITVGTSLAAGFMEETIFRAYPLSTIMRKCRNEKLIIAGLVISSVIFGASHGFNTLAGARVDVTILQVIETCCIGLFLGALYLRCGNLWPSIVVHSVNDIIALTNVSDISETGVITGGITWFTWIDVVTCVIIGIIGIWMIRPAKRAEIMEIWSKKWDMAEKTVVDNSVDKEYSIAPNSNR